MTPILIWMTTNNIEVEANCYRQVRESVILCDTKRITNPCVVGNFDWEKIYTKEVLHKRLCFTHYPLIHLMVVIVRT